MSHIIRFIADIYHLVPDKFLSSLSSQEIVKMTIQRLVCLLLVSDRIFIQMNADYGGKVSMHDHLMCAMNKLLPGVRQYSPTPFLDEFYQSENKE